MTTVTWGTKISVSDTVTNDPNANGSAGASEIWYYFSTDTTRASGTYIGKQKVGALKPGRHSALKSNLKVPTDKTPGTYYIVACADSTSKVAEINETNNCAYSQAITLAPPDLTEVINSVSPSTTVIHGKKISVSDTVTNGGGFMAGSSATRFYLSTTTSVTGATLIGTRSVSTLSAGGTSTKSSSITIPKKTTTGTYYLIACADGKNKVVESNENNNCSTATELTITD